MLSIIAAYVPRDVRVYIGKSEAIPLINEPTPSIGMHYHDGASKADRTSPIDRIAPIELSKVNARDFNDKLPSKRPL